MKQVLIERPRRGGHGARRPGKPRYRSVEEGDDVPSKESVHRWYGWNNKEQSDSFNPLYGFLRSRLGRPWNQVWKEICEHNHDHMGLHLRRHMQEIIEVNTQLGPEGKILDSKGAAMTGWRWGGQFYVHPKTGLLCEIPRRRRNYRRIAPPKTIIELDGQKYHKHNGIWYRVTVEPARDAYFTDVFGHATGFLSNWDARRDLARAYGEEVVCTSKQQVGKKVCRKLNQLSP